ncbi:PAS domain S-box protein [Methanochimaera problematica]|nr:PAS domain S-box protein [Methanoplanus sp. FWC-SCC4]
MCSSFQNSVDETYWVTKEKKVILANKKACYTLGYNIEEILGKNFGEIRIDIDDDFTFSTLWDRLKSRNIIHYEIKHKKSDGTYYDVESHAKRYCLNNIEFICIFSRDISERKKYENILKESENEKTAIINAVHENVIYYDKDLSIKWINEKPAEAVGKKPEDIIGKKCYTFSHNGECECSECTIKKVIKTGQSLVEEKYKSSGRCLEISGYPVYDNCGNITGAVESILDITRRKNTEIALQTREKQYKELFTTMTNAFALHEIITDDQNVPVDYRFLEVNPAFEEMSGIKAADITGRTFLEVFPMGRKGMIDKYSHVALTGESVSFTDYNPVFEKHHNIYAYSPRKGQFATVFTDITDVVKLKNEQKISLDQINKNLEELAILNDEIRNPLQAIMGYIMLEDFKYSEKVISQIEIIDKLVNRLDQRWLESEKIRDFLRKHYDFE